MASEKKDGGGDDSMAGAGAGAGAGGEKKRFEVKQWNAVALWAWGESDLATAG